MDDSKHRKEKPPPRIRLAKNIDLTKAKPGCKRCNGDGIRGYKTADLGDGKGDTRIPIICRCVSRNGGVKPDELDRIMGEAAKHIEDGVFHEHIVADFHATKDDQKPRLVAAFFCGAVDRRKDKTARDTMEKVIDLLGKRKDWADLRVKAIRMLMRDAADPLCDENVRELAQLAMTAARQSMN